MVKRTLTYFLILLSPIFWVDVVGASEKMAKTPAFPGAQGYGALSHGGRGGRVIFVTNLADYRLESEPVIPGSLRAACQAEGPRIVIFRLGGIIELKERLHIKNPYITIAGQTAPGDGICLKHHGISAQGTHDVIIRYLRSRPGDLLQQVMTNSFVIHSSHDVIYDHCSGSWANDETMTLVRADRCTVQWCFFTESLRDNYHPKGEHGYGTLLRTDGYLSFHHNLLAHHETRCPRPGTYGMEPGMLFDFRNNVIYNWCAAAAGYTADDPVRMNYVGNTIKAGPSTVNPESVLRIGSPITKIFLIDNVLTGNPEATADNWTFVNWRTDAPKWDHQLNRADQPFHTYNVATEPADQAYDRVLNEAGATLPVRDIVDQRVAHEVRSGTGRVIDTQRDVGGWCEYRSAPPPVDTDNDGMPDKWENQHGFDINDVSDANGDNDGDGYTNIEECLNASDPRAKDPPVYVW